MNEAKRRGRDASTELLDERVQKMAEESMEVDKEVLLTDDLDEALCLHHVAGHTGKAIWVNLLRGQERGHRCDVAEVGGARRREGPFFVRCREVGWH